MLWLNHTGVVTGEEIDLWIPLNASTDNFDCQQVLAATLQANSRPANPGDTVTAGGYQFRLEQGSRALDAGACFVALRGP